MPSDNWGEKPFDWTELSDRAAFHIAQGKMTMEEVAHEAGAADRTLRRWKEHPEFQGRIDQYVKSLNASVIARGKALAVGDKMRRMSELEDLYFRARRLMEARGSDASRKGVPGWDTGLLVHRIKGIGSGDNFQQVDEYEFDRALMQELRQTLEQAAKEMGQWDTGAPSPVNVTQVVLHLPEKEKLPDARILEHQAPAGPAEIPPVVG